MVTFKKIFLTLLVVLSLSVSSSASSKIYKNTRSEVKKFGWEEYVYIKDVLYHIVYDDSGSIVSFDRVED